MKLVTLKVVLALPDAAEDPGNDARLLLDAGLENGDSEPSAMWFHWRSSVEVERVTNIEFPDVVIPVDPTPAEDTAADQALTVWGTLADSILQSMRNGKEEA